MVLVADGGATAAVGAAVAPWPFAVVLDRTVAHAQGGGQPADRGVLRFDTPVVVVRGGCDNGDVVASPTAAAYSTYDAFEFHMVKGGTGALGGGAILHYGRFIVAGEVSAAAGDGVHADGERDEAAEKLAAHVPAAAPAAPGKAPASPEQPQPPASAAAAALLGTTVGVGIHADFRRAAARLHSAGHLLDLAVKNVWAAAPAALGPLGPPLRPGKGYHFADGPYVEYDGDVPAAAREALPALLDAEIRRLVAADAATAVGTAWKADAAALAALGVSADDVGHLPADRPVRVVSVGGGGNACPCGGTHVRSAGELAGLRVRALKCRKGKAKLSYDIV